MNAAERETTINASDADETVAIWTAQRKYINRLKKHPSFTLTDEGTYSDGTPYAFFSIPAAEWNPATGAKRKRNLTDDQRTALRERLAQAREKK